MPTWGRCFAAALQKNALLRRSAYLTTALEIIMPSLFMLLLSIGYWLSSDDHNPAGDYASTLINITDLVYHSNIFCPYYTDFGPIGMPTCSNLDYRNIPWDVNLQSFTVGGTDYQIQPTMYGMYTTNMTVATAVFEMMSDLDKSFVIPDFDSMLILMGLAQEIYSIGFPLTRSAKASMSHGGYLIIASNDDRVTNAFINYCNSNTNSFYCGVILYSTTFPTMDAARDYAYKNGNAVWAAVDLTQLNYDAIYYGLSLQGSKTAYTISMNYTATPWTFETLRPFTTGLGKKEFLFYLGSGFLTLQQFVNSFIVDLAQSSPFTTVPPLANTPFGETLATGHIVAAPMPTRAYFVSEFLVQSGEFIPLVSTFAMLYGLSRTLSQIVEEKEAKVREAMLIMGLPITAFYASWLVSQMVVNLLATLGSTIVLKLTLFQSVDFVIMWVVAYAFSLNVMAISMLISVFFSKPRIAAIVGPLIMFVSVVPYYAIPEGTPNVYMVLASALPCTAYAQAINTFVSYATNGYGVTWANMFSGTYSIALAIFLMACDTVFYLLIALYLDLVIPSEHGTHKHPLFMCQALWRLCRRKRDPPSSEREPLLLKEESTDKGPAAGDLHQPFHPSTALVVKVTDLEKTYSGDIRAVRGISFNLHQGHIHALLGHNGAGKSTTINMLVGLVPPTSGSIEICGMDLSLDLNSIRRNLGYCPQHNIIWPTLSVAQHLRMYARLKSASWDVEEQVDSTLELVKLVDKKNAAAGSLSGGQKRKLCVGISLIGGSPFLLLDEPTAGMDVEARRAMWEMLLKIRRERCVLLSTHFMDEADLLGDHITIMSHGQIYSSGTPLFLKSKLGIGYSVTCVLENERNVDAAVVFLNKVYVACCSGAPGLEAEELEVTKRGKEVVIRFPMTFSAVAAGVFEALEREQMALHVLSFGLSLTTMEDVFLSIAQLGEADELVDALRDSHTPATDKNDTPTLQDQRRGSDASDAHSIAESPVLAQVSEDELRRLHASHRTFARHFAAMFVKRFHCAKRDRRMVCFQVAMPIIFLCIALLILLIHPPDQPLLVLDGTMYGENTDVLYTPPFDASNPNETLFPASGPLSIPGLMGSEYGGVYNGVDLTECTALSSSSLCLSKRMAAEYNTHSVPRYTAFTPITTNLGGNTLFPATSSTVFHNATAPHSLPEVLSLYTNLAYRNLYGRPGSSISVANYPFTLSEAQQVLISSIQRIVSAIFILIPFTFVPANYVCFIVKEKECKAKHLQWVAGGNMLAFWLSSLLWDLLTFLATETLCIAVFFAFKRDEFIGNAETFAATFSLFFLYGLASIPFSYVLSFAFKSSSAAQNITMMGNFFAGFLLVMAAQILSAIESTRSINRWLCVFYRIVPAYALGEGIITLTGRSLAKFLGGGDAGPFALLNTDSDNGGFFGGVGTSLIYLGAAAPFFFLVLLVLEGAQSILVRISIGRVRPHANAEELRDYGPEDEAVAEERREVEVVEHLPPTHPNGPPVAIHGRGGDGVTIQHLRKVYNRSKIAVKDLSFGVKSGETFALLGTNGAGKTTTISTLTGEHTPTCGDAFINGKSIVKDMHEARQWIGYCPQFDALHEHMTVREHLVLYCRLRGLTGREVTEQVEKTLTALSLEKYATTMAKSLSGGNKRKLSLGIALIGDTKCILLDEPTAGMDPVARRDLWKSLALVARERSIVLTTHHLEEVEALADRVGIMVGGKMMGLGSLQQLKSKYVGDVFELQISFAPPRGQTTNTLDEVGCETENVSATVEALKSDLPSGVSLTVAEANGNKLTLTVEGAPLSALFRAAQGRKVALESAYAAEEGGDNSAQPVRRITEYALSQATLEQVFLRIGILARQEDDADTATVGPVLPTSQREV